MDEHLMVVAVVDTSVKGRIDRTGSTHINFGPPSASVFSLSNSHVPFPETPALYLQKSGASGLLPAEELPFVVAASLPSSIPPSKYTHPVLSSTAS